MPEPLLYLKAMGASAIISAMCVLVMVGPRRTTSSAWLNAACVLAIGFGLAYGCDALALRWIWPPAKGLDRFLMIVVPTVLGIELMAGYPSVPRWVAWSLRTTLAAATPKILLHGSVYLSGADNQWTLSETVAALVVCGVLLAVTWGFLSCLSQRSAGVSIPLALGLTTQCAGLTVMLAGYLKGGAAAFPLAASIVTTAIAARLIAQRSGAPANFGSPAIIGIGIVGLFGVLFIGHFFGRLSTDAAVAMMLIPLLCWASELPLLRHRKPWLVGLVRLALVAIPLLVVLAVAKREFDRKMAPLLGRPSVSMRHVALPVLMTRSARSRQPSARIASELTRSFMIARCRPSSSVDASPVST